MRIPALALCAVAALAACSPPPEAVIGPTEVEGSVEWDYPRTVDWVNRPMLVVPRPGGIYPQVPDVRLALTCTADGRLDVDGLRIVTDVGSYEIPEAAGLSNGVLAVIGEPVWQSTGYELQAELVLSPTPDQLRNLLTGDKLILTAPTPEGDYGTTYPAPPRALAEAFLRDCAAGQGR
ncbi:hypothetical protein [Caulobacter sp. 17J65-9]|uniref:hypothetical protein n=1 Tax=Caulobacter sp. 17J65-9 TaxID=2709382 RepID=UPI0013C90102|nr:hypothetical protein [Caulobacter sp. 17J65-9]NEX95222.1 hypothetical protein [Caulobacter sp. 17J65-9]